MDNFNLTSITLPNTIVNLGEYAFANATNLKQITIPEGVKEQQIICLMAQKSRYCYFA